MKVVGLEGPLIDLDYQGRLYVLPVAQTDFLERAAVNAANHPAPPPIHTEPAPFAEVSVPTPPAKSGAPSGNALAAKLAPDLVVFDHTANVDRLIAGGAEALAHRYVLLQFGGGRRWETALKNLGPAIQAAHEHRADFGTVLVPVQNSTVQSSIALYRESMYVGPMIDPRKAQTITDLWAKYGHEGTFALALVGPNGDAIARTEHKGRGVDHFDDIVEALARLGAAK